MQARRLEVTGRAVQRYWGLSTADAVAVAGETGLLPMLNRDQVLRGREQGRRVFPVFDAEAALELGRRETVDEREVVEGLPGLVLVVQQSVVRADLDYDPSGRSSDSWRRVLGWSPELTEQEALLSASGWWPVAPELRPQVCGVVSTIGSFVVTVGVVPDGPRPVLGQRPDSLLCRFHLRPAHEGGAVGDVLLSLFAGKRVAPRRGSSFLVPQS